MKNHVTSLELSKELKAKGFPQESLFYWNKWSHHTEPWLLTKSEQAFYKKEGAKDPEWVLSAPIATEIGLPIVISQNGEDHNLNIYRPSQFLKGVDLSLGYQVGYENGVFSHDNIDIQSAPTLQEAMAKMWLYLKDNGLI